MENESHAEWISKASLGITGVLILTLVVWQFGGAEFLHFLGFGYMTEWYIFTARSFFWICVLLVWLYATQVEKQVLLIWQERKYKFSRFLGLLFSIVGLVYGGTLLANLVIRLIMHKKELSEPLRQTIAVLKTNRFLLVYTALTAGITEELIFRGYLQPRLEMILKNRNGAIFLCALLFGLAHCRYGTVVNVADPIIIGLVLSIYYSKYRNIKVLIVFHVLWDLAVLYINIKKQS